VEIKIHNEKTFSMPKSTGKFIEVNNMKRSVPYKKFLDKVLKDPEMALGYLNTSLEAGDLPAFLLAIKNVSDVHGQGMTALARKAKLDRVHLYRILSKHGNPTMANIVTLLSALGFKLTITYSDSKKAAA